MENMNINVVAILVAVVVNFFIGFIWYTPLFGKAWAAEMGYNSEDTKPEASVMVKGMVLMIAGNFMMAWVFSHNIAAWDFVPGVKEMGLTASALNAAIFTWVGFFVPRHLGAIAWEQKSWKLFAINAGYDLVALLAVGFILVYWR